MSIGKHHNEKYKKFNGAILEEVCGERNWKPRDVIFINPDLVGGFYDHTILIAGNKIRVMETAYQIKEILEA